MPVESAADRAAFVSTNDFGASIIYTAEGQSAVTLSGIFDNEYLLQPVEGMETGAESATPKITCRTADLPADAAVGDELTVDGVDYAVVELMPDGTGMSEIRLHKA